MRWTLLYFLAVLTTPLRAETPAPVKDFSFVNQSGAKVTLNEFKGGYTLISFIFTRCPMPNMCPLNFRLSKELSENWKKLSWWGRGGVTLKILAVTLDPEFDTPAVLAEYANKHEFDPQIITLATGDPQTMADFASEFNVMGFPSGGTISHNMKTILVGPNLVPIKEWRDNEWTPDEIISLVRPKTRPFWLYILVPLFFILGVGARRRFKRRSTIR